ncbi:MAG: hypothetical protein ACKV2V_31275, partial [Blastocatellia bacterium]
MQTSPCLVNTWRRCGPSLTVTARLCHLAVFVCLLALTGLAADPGNPITNTAATVANDQQPGSVLIYNYYTSSVNNPGQENTRLNLTNVGPASTSAHMFLIDGVSCAPADFYVCLTTNQTASFLAAEFDPGVSGYAIVVEVDSAGRPVISENGNHLIGDSYIKLSSGHQANLAAIA